MCLQIPYSASLWLCGRAKRGSDLPSVCKGAPGSPLSLATKFVGKVWPMLGVTVLYSLAFSLQGKADSPLLGSSIESLSPGFQMPVSFPLLPEVHRAHCSQDGCLHTAQEGNRKWPFLYVGVLSPSWWLVVLHLPFRWKMIHLVAMVIILRWELFKGSSLFWREKW